RIRGPAHGIGIRCSEERVGVRHGPGQRIVDCDVVAFEDFKAPAKLGFGGGEDREELEILDRVVTVEVGDQRLQTRSKPGAELGRGDTLLAEGSGFVTETAGEDAEVLVNIEPEPG